MGFNSRAPRGARPDRRVNTYYNASFNSRAPRGARRPGLRGDAPSRMFQFTCPSRSTTSIAASALSYTPFQFTCPSRSTTPQHPAQPAEGVVSIHVPLAEHDETLQTPRARVCSFNSRAPRGARRIDADGQKVRYEFQFTCPSRSTTLIRQQDKSCLRFQFTCPSRSTTQGNMYIGYGLLRFNSRAPRGARRF